jgi:hypothetical protein
MVPIHIVKPERSGDLCEPLRAVALGKIEIEPRLLSQVLRVRTPPPTMSAMLPGLLKQS